MEVRIIEGPNTDENIKKVYDYLVESYRKEQKAKTKKCSSCSDAQMSYNRTKR